MYSSSSSYQLIKGITPNVPLGSKDKNLFCMKKKPCWRLQKCNICWARSFKYYEKQIESVFDFWSLAEFVTISINQPMPFDEDTFKKLKQLRQKLTKQIGRKGKYVFVFTLVNMSDQFKPHFHAIVSPINKAKLDFIMTKYGSKIKYKISIVKISNGVGFFKQKLWYMLEKNLYPSFKAKPHRLRLFTASKGFYTGRPRNLEKFAWLI